MVAEKTLETVMHGLDEYYEASSPKGGATESFETIISGLAEITPVNVKETSANPFSADVIPLGSRTRTLDTICSVATEEGNETIPVNGQKTSAKSLSAAAIPLDSRTCTLDTIGSVATEEGTFESRDAANSLSRGEDGGRDDVGDTAESLIPTAVAPAVVTDDSENVDDRNILTRAGDNIDSALNRTGENIDSAVHNFYSNLELGAAKVWGSVTCSSANADEQKVVVESAPCADDLLSITEEETNLKNADSDILSVKTQGTAKSAKSSKSAKSQGMIKSVESQVTIKSVKTQGTIKSVKTEGTIRSVKTQGTVQSNSIQSTLKPLRPSKAEPRFCASMFGCSGQEEGVLENESIELPPMTFDDIITDTINITSDQPHILDTFSDQGSDDNTTIESDEKSLRALRYVSPKAKSLLSEIENIENNLFEVRKSASMERMGEIKKRQDPFIQKMASIKQSLLEQQALLQAAPAETKKDYFNAISRAAVLNAEVETRRAELELKKIKLETMKIEDEMARLAMGSDLNDTFDSMDETLMSNDTDDDGAQHAFNLFARYAASKWHKRKNKAKGDHLSR